MTAPLTAWARHLASPAPCTTAHQPLLTAAEAERVQRHRDQLLNALQAQDRLALLGAKHQVLEAAFGPRDADSPALRGALRDLSWRMAGLLLPRGARH